MAICDKTGPTRLFLTIIAYLTTSFALAQPARPVSAPPQAPSKATPKAFVLPEDDEQEAEDKLKGLTVRSEEQANREALDQLKKFTTPINAWGVGLSSPEVLTLDLFRLYSAHWGLRLSLAPPIPFRIALNQEIQSKQVDGRLQISTPASTGFLNVLYGPHASADALYFPFASSTFYVSGGLGYRRLSVKGKLSSPLFVCFVEASETCDDSVKYAEVGANVHVNTEYQSTSLMWRFGTGWFYPLKQNQYLHINIFGLTKALRTYRHASADTFLDQDLVVGGDSSKAKASAGEILGSKSDQIETRTVDRASIVENIAIPTIGVGTGFTF